MLISCSKEQAIEAIIVEFLETREDHCIFLRRTLQQFEKQTIKKARWGHMSAYDDGHTQGKREGALAVLAEVREKYYKGVEVMDILDSLKEKYTKDV